MKLFLGDNMKIVICLGELHLMGKMNIWWGKMSFLLVGVDFYHPPSRKTLHFKAWTHYMSVLASNCVIFYIVIVIYLITQDRDFINYIFSSIHIPLQLSQFFIKLCLAFETYTSSLLSYIQYKEKMREISDPSNYFALSFLCLQL